MAYATYSDVAGLTSRTYTASGDPSTTQITQWIADCSETVDGYAKQAGYIVPLTHASDLAWAKMTVVFGVAAMAEEAKFTQMQEENEEHRSVKWRAAYDKRIQDLIDRKNVLVGELTDPESSHVPRSFAGLTLTEAQALRHFKRDRLN